MTQVEIVPSILAADFARLGEQAREAFEAGAKRLHVDVMDGVFVPNLSMGPQLVSSLRKIADAYGATLEAHLMIIHPERYLEAFKHAGADLISVHVEATPNAHRTLTMIRDLGMKVGLTLNPGTPLVMTHELVHLTHRILVMTVDPGFGGQAFNERGLDRVASVAAYLEERDLRHRVDLQVDGGINEANAGSVAAAGATMLIAGSAVFNDQGSVGENMKALLRAANGKRAPEMTQAPVH